LYAQLVLVSTNTCRTAAQPFAFPDSNRDACRTALQLRNYYRSHLGRIEALDPVKQHCKHVEVQAHRPVRTWSLGSLGCAAERLYCFGDAHGQAAQWGYAPARSTAYTLLHRSMVPVLAVPARPA
jgi:hypothetical protein